VAYFKTIFQHLDGGLLKNMNTSTSRAGPWDEIQNDNHPLTMLYSASLKMVLITRL